MGIPQRLFTFQGLTLRALRALIARDSVPL